MSKPKILGISRWKPSHATVRLENPLAAVERAHLATTGVYNGKMGPGDEHFLEAGFSSDLVIFSGPSCQADYKFITYLRKCGVKVAIDHDDHPFKISPVNPAYNDWGLKETDGTLQDGTVLYRWRDGQTVEPGVKQPFTLKRNREMKRWWLRCLQECDAVITTTARLARTIQRYKGWRLEKPIYILPNYANFNLWRRMRPMTRSPYTNIFWQGGHSHIRDLRLVRPALRRIAMLYPQVRFTFFGFADEKIANYIPAQRVEVLHWVDSYIEYSFRMMTLDIDIAIAPLEDNEFNRCKSPLKFVEYGALGIPSVLSAVPPYTDVLEMPQGLDAEWPAMLAETEEDWVEMLSVLIEAEPQRVRMGENAFREVRNYWDLDAHAHDIMEVYERILDGDLSEPLPEPRDVARTELDVEHAPDRAEGVDQRSLP